MIKNVKGGFQTLDLKGVNLSTTPVTIPGIYNAVLKMVDDNDKPIVAHDLVYSNSEVVDTMVTSYLKETNKITITIGNTYAVAITNANAVTCTMAESGGTGDYTDLDNKPSINGVTLSGNKTSSDLNIVTPNVYAFSANYSAEVDEYDEIQPTNVSLDFVLEHNPDFKKFYDNCVIGDGVVVGCNVSISKGGSVFNGVFSLSGNVVLKSSNTIMVKFDPAIVDVKSGIVTAPEKYTLNIQGFTCSVSEDTAMFSVVPSVKILDGVDNTRYEEAEEVLIGTWIDGSPLYRTVINTGGLPNNDVYTITTGVPSNIDQVCKIYGMATDGSTCIPLPYHNLTDGVALWINKSIGTIYIKTINDCSVYTDSFVVLEYTKATI